MAQRNYRHSSAYTEGSAARKLQPQWEQEKVLQPKQTWREELTQQDIKNKPRVGHGIDAISMLILRKKKLIAC